MFGNSVFACRGLAFTLIRWGGGSSPPVGGVGWGFFVGGLFVPRLQTVVINQRSGDHGGRDPVHPAQKREAPNPVLPLN